ncbi:hypothetical protein [Desulfovibrio ferrophilus]|uniref:Uncharacterized protein n=1 Tax=Desulfovibrio ferrophilus TaxID=241368 RepID=A0A2Z6B0C9_9BACT|nr:hypothetical protein [Desulfovibrio ferrophilus]BBD08969.1 uncharacterized protein DFE_2243 [Desulfovibrio ferrophilus]
MSLLAVDLGLRTGLALYNPQGRLVWYRSHNFGSQARLKRGAHGILKDIPELDILVLEGGGTLADLWANEGVKRGLDVHTITAEIWRKRLLLPRQQTSGAKAKRHADQRARKIIQWSNAPRPTSLRHDAAEAILIGLWGVLNAGWLTELPAELKA